MKQCPNLKHEVEDTLAAMEADNGVTIPHEPAVAIMNGASPIQAFRDYRGLTLKELSNRTNLSMSYLSEIERGRKPRISFSPGTESQPH